MPWPMVHFAVAYEIFKGHPSSSFLLGSIAPDAIHAREGTTRKEKMLSHFVHDDRLADKGLLTSKYMAYIGEREDPEWKTYVAGYFIHIYTDERWTTTLYADFEQEVQKEPQEIRRIYDEEVSQLEYNLMRSNEWVDIVIAKLQAARGFDMDSLVSAEEAERYREIKLNWLNNEKNEPGIQLIYYTEDKVNDFIKRTANEARELLKDWESLERLAVQG
ncbi:hypothetical protein [Paenibacillus sp. Marseille-Q4541]|uniref:hypothetical protein n=1 Tax=Paenibacillus sp. Marseille-Q4541 TaxID=2831522 RepID=UPI001BAAE0E0|nr:hypothetical protein [Paenibacillus sp. Marseille-Q4541]